MGEDENEVLRIGMEVALKPVTDIAADVLGIAGGAWLHATHERIRDKLSRRTAEILKERDVENPREPSPSVLVPLLREAQKESREELLDLWAKLIAASVDPTRAHLYRRQYVEIVKQLEPMDAVVLQELANPSNDNPKNRIAGTLGVIPDQVEVSFRNLFKLELAGTIAESTIESGRWHISALGKEFIRAIS